MLSVCRYCFKPYLYIKPISPNVNLLLLSIFHTEETQGQEGTRNCPVARGIQCGVRMQPHTSFHPGVSLISKRRGSDLKNSDARFLILTFTRKSQTQESGFSLCLPLSLFLTTLVSLH